jgi:large subunit ribosomal protein L21e
MAGKRKGGERRKTRHKFQKPLRRKGKVNLTRYLQDFNPGDQVQLQCEPAIQTGMYWRRFHGLTATVTRKIKTCYELKIMDKNKEKTITVHPVHLKKVK